MARGRMISRSLGSSRKFAELPGTSGRLAEFSQLLFTLIVSHTDDWGRMAGDPFTVKHAVFPTSSRREDDFADALAAMSRVGLIKWFDADGVQVVQIVNFDAHQVGLHKRTPSKFPEFSGKFREIPSELKRREEKKIIRTVAADATTEDVDSDLDATIPPTTIAAFIRRFCELYSKHRHKAKYLVRKSKDVPNVVRLLRLYDVGRLEKLTVVLLTTDDDWVSRTDRGIGILAAKASWLDDKLAEYEAEHGAIEAAS